MRNCSLMTEGTALQPDEPEKPDLLKASRGRATNTMMGGLIAAAALLLLLPVSWWATDRLEADNDFCNSCHLPNGDPLHRQIRADFDALPAPNLSARHADLKVPGRPTSEGHRCMDCHGGVGLSGRAKVKLLSVKDSILYLTGQFDEPTEMSIPLGDEDCRQCHMQFEPRNRGFDGQAFHAKTVHNEGLGVNCVECHSGHDTEVDPRRWYLNIDAVRSRCGQCHVEYADAEPGFARDFALSDP